MARLNPQVSVKDHQTGKSNATVTLVEYGDYQCSYCGHAYPLVKRLLKENGNVLQFVFRNFPLQDIHPMAMSAACAAEAAALQEKFWEMHDLIFEHQQELSNDLLLKLAVQLKLDEKKFAKDWQSETTFSRVESDFETGVRSGVNGTPTFFVNGSRFNAYDETYNSLLMAISIPAL
ncbi:MAG TPA: thioredoxin domain-containing protein [Flavisolibacter sp.]|nr:thioredoxin domain-containing protein [Flavisolibacter sp.]